MNTILKFICKNDVPRLLKFHLKNNKGALTLPDLRAYYKVDFQHNSHSDHVKKPALIKSSLSWNHPNGLATYPM